MRQVLKRHAKIQRGAGAGERRGERCEVGTQQLTVANSVVAEPESGVAAMGFVIELAEPNGRESVVRVTTHDGTAVSGLDYEPVDLTVTFAPEETIQIVYVPILADELSEDVETLVLLADPIDNVAVVRPIAIGEIRDRPPVLGRPNVPPPTPPADIGVVCVYVSNAIICSYAPEIPGTPYPYPYVPMPPIPMRPADPAPEPMPPLVIPESELHDHDHEHAPGYVTDPLLAPPHMQRDVNRNGDVSAIDAIIVINSLRYDEKDRSPRNDANGDGRVSALDALSIINHLSRVSGGEGEQYQPGVTSTLAISGSSREGWTRELVDNESIRLRADGTGFAATSHEEAFREHAKSSGDGPTIGLVPTEIGESDVERIALDRVTSDLAGIQLAHGAFESTQ